MPKRSQLFDVLLVACVSALVVAAVIMVGRMRWPGSGSGVTTAAFSRSVELQNEEPGTPSPESTEPEAGPTLTPIDTVVPSSDRMCGPADSQVPVSRIVDDRPVTITVKCPIGWWLSDQAESPEVTVQSVAYDPLPPPGGFAKAEIFIGYRDQPWEIPPGAQQTTVVVGGHVADRVESEENGDRYVEVLLVVDGVRYAIHGYVTNVPDQAESDALMSTVDDVIESINFAP